MGSRRNEDVVCSSLVSGVLCTGFLQSLNALVAPNTPLNSPSGNPSQDSNPFLLLALLPEVKDQTVFFIASHDGNCTGGAKKEKRPGVFSWSSMPEEGVEPTRPCEQSSLSRSCLPISTLRLSHRKYTPTCPYRQPFLAHESITCIIGLAHSKHQPTHKAGQHLWMNRHWSTAPKKAT